MLIGHTWIVLPWVLTLYSGIHQLQLVVLFLFHHILPIHILYPDFWMNSRKLYLNPCNTIHETNLLTWCPILNLVSINIILVHVHVRLQIFWPKFSIMMDRYWNRVPVSSSRMCMYKSYPVPGYSLTMPWQLGLKG